MRRRRAGAPPAYLLIDIAPGARAPAGARRRRVDRRHVAHAPCAHDTRTARASAGQARPPWRAGFIAAAPHASARALIDMRPPCLAAPMPCQRLPRVHMSTMSQSLSLAAPAARPPARLAAATDATRRAGAATAPGPRGGMGAPLKISRAGTVGPDGQSFSASASKHLFQSAPSLYVQLKGLLLFQFSLRGSILKRCGTCDRAFDERLGKRGRPRVFCSAECSSRRSYEESEQSRQRRLARERGYHAKRAAAERARRPKRFCKVCYSELIGSRRKFCSLACNQAAITAAKAARSGASQGSFVCVECGSSFSATTYTKNLPRKFCGPECRKRNSDRLRTRARRAATRTLVVFAFDPISIFQRDQWTCQACGVETPIDLKGTFEPNAPELDHIIPLSRGGFHSPDNCRCLCRSCNADKGDRTDQEWLVAA